MKVDVNFERLFDEILDAWTSKSSYYHASAVYYKKHGHGAYLDYTTKRDEEIEHIRWTSKWNDAGDSVVNAMFGILNLEYADAKKAFAAARALRRWYENTNWQYLPDADLIERLGKFVTG